MGVGGAMGSAPMGSGQMGGGGFGALDPLNMMASPAAGGAAQRGGVKKMAASKASADDWDNW